MCIRDRYNTYHHTECKILNSLTDKDELGEVLFPLRMFLIGTKQGSELVKLMNDSKVLAMLKGEWNCNEMPYQSNDYFAILNLPWKTGNERSCKTPLSESRKFISLMLIFDALQDIGFFHNDKNATQVR